jgi:hypothetical protein
VYLTRRFFDLFYNPSWGSNWFDHFWELLVKVRIGSLILDNCLWRKGIHVPYLLLPTSSRFQEERTSQYYIRNISGWILHTESARSTNSARGMYPNLFNLVMRF